MRNFRARTVAIALFFIAGLGLSLHRGSPPADLPDGDATVQYHQALGKNFSRGPDDPRPPKVPNPHFFNERAFPLGEIPLERWQIAVAEAADLVSQNRGSADPWQFRGPTNVGGRVTCLAVSPADQNRAFAGAAEGGVLRTTNGGTTWESIFDEQPVLSVGALTLDPNDPDVIYVGTGEVNPGGGSVAYGGQGVFRSTDGGDTWAPLGLEESGSIGRIRVDPQDSSRIFVGAMGTLWSRSETRGVYRTTNGGATWDRVLYVADDTGCVDLIQRPDDPDVLYAAMWERLRQPESYDYAGPNCAIHRTTDGGDTWAIVGGGLPTPSNNGGRIGLTLCQSSPNVMYAVYTAASGFFDGLYKSTNGGFNWTRTSDGSLSGVFASYGWWFGNLRAHPLDPDIVFVFGLDFYRTTNGGNSYSNVGSSMHVDHHALAFGPGANPVIFAGNDGGIYQSGNGGSSWSFVGNQPITQFYRVALDPGAPDAVLGGAQDNGTVKTDSAIDGYGALFGGDGFEPLVHPTNSNQIWSQYQYGNLFYSSNGGGNWGSALGGVGNDRTNWNSPIAQDPLDPNVRYWGTHRVYRSTSPTNWTPISSDLTGGTQGNSGQVSGTLTTIGVSPVDNDVIWSGSDDGYVYVTSNGGNFWDRVDGALPERWITSVRPDPSSASSAFVTISGYRWGEALPRVYRTTNYGVDWTSVAGNLPDAPVNDILIDPDLSGHYVVATDVGVFQSFDSGSNWASLGTGLPNVVVTDFAFAPSSRTMVAATFGRGFYSIELPDTPAYIADAEPGSVVNWLRAPSPHPVSHGTLLRWDRQTSELELEIFTSSGRRIWSKIIPGGEEQLWWDRSTNRGERAAAGVYFLRARTTAPGGESQQSQQQTLVVR